ncbi:MAG TPA: Rrf2 family transcriptional regulator [Chitinophagales bacterium]|nr:Rrf2 family transcriptional regulator [Chitinophagales bacterium]
MFSKACEHGIKAMIYVATQSIDGKRVKICDLAEKTGTPEAYTSKILSLLTKHKIVQSLTGPSGGFIMDQQMMKQTKISQIVFAIDGDNIYNGCALGLSECDHSQPCPLHENFLKIRDDLKSMLETTTVYDLATKYKAGETILMR